MTHSVVRSSKAREPLRVLFSREIATGLPSGCVYSLDESLVPSVDQRCSRCDAPGCREGRRFYLVVWQDPRHQALVQGLCSSKHTPFQENLKCVCLPD
jgi:hypothetical protein